MDITFYISFFTYISSKTYISSTKEVNIRTFFKTYLLKTAYCMLELDCGI